MNQAATTFVSQNIGARNIPRAKRGSLTAFYMSTAITIAMASVLWLTAGQFVAMFNQDPEVIRYGTLFIRTNSTLTFTCCATQIFSGSLRGAGDSRTPMFIMLFSYVLFRQIYLFVITQFINTPAVLGKTDPLIQLPLSTWSRIWARGSMAFLASSYVFVWAPTSMRAERARTCWLYRSPLR